MDTGEKPVEKPAEPAVVKPPEPPAQKPPDKPAEKPAEAPLTINDFKRIELRVGTVLEVAPHPNADRLLVVKVDIGGGQTRQLVAGIKQWYEPDKLVGKNMIVVCNLQPAKLRGVESQGMLLAATDAATGNVVVLTTEKPAAPGSKIS